MNFVDQRYRTGVPAVGSDANVKEFLRGIIAARIYEDVKEAGHIAHRRRAYLGDLYAESGQTFTRIVLGCIEAKLCKKIFVGKLSPRSTQCNPLHRSQIANFYFKTAAMFPFFNKK